MAGYGPWSAENPWRGKPICRLGLVRILPACPIACVSSPSPNSSTKQLLVTLRHVVQQNEEGLSRKFFGNKGHISSLVTWVA